MWRYHAVFTNQSSPLVEAEKTHRGHAVIEQVFADLKAGPLAHLPSKSFNANAAWLAIATIAFNLTPRPRRHRRRPVRPGRDRDHPRPPDPHPGPGSHLGTTNTAAPAHPLALGQRVAAALDRCHDHLNPVAPDRHDQGTPVESPDRPGDHPCPKATARSPEHHIYKHKHPQTSIGGFRLR